MTKSTFITLLTTTALVALAGAANAQATGFGGIGYSFTSGVDQDGNNEFSARGGYLEGGVTYDLGQHTFIASGSYYAYSDVVENDPFDEDDPGYSYTLSAHYLYGLNDAISLGGFAAYGEAVPDGDDEDFWTFVGIGAEAHYDLSAQTTAYAQLAWFDVTNDDGGDSGLGAQDSVVARVGLNFSPSDSATLYVDFELAGLQDFEDAGEDWLWTQLSVGGETFVDGTNLAITFDLSLYGTEAQTPDDDEDEVMATSASIGVRYYFGERQTARGQRIIGAPSTFSISSLFPEYHN